MPTWIVWLAVAACTTLVLPVVAGRIANGWPSFSHRVQAVLLTLALVCASIAVSGTTIFTKDKATVKSRLVSSRSVQALKLKPIRYEDGMQGEAEPTFNRYVGVPNIGDERNFVGAKIDGADGGFSDNLRVNQGDVVLVRVYIHNNAVL